MASAQAKFEYYIAQVDVSYLLACPEAGADSSRDRLQKEASLSPPVSVPPSRPLTCRLLLPTHVITRLAARITASNSSPSTLVRFAPSLPQPSIPELTRTCTIALNKLEQQINVPKAYGVLAVGTFFSSFIFFNIFAGFLSNLLGWALPAYLSLKALDTPGHDESVLEFQSDRRGVRVTWVQADAGFVRRAVTPSGSRTGSSSEASTSSRACRRFLSPGAFGGCSPLVFLRLLLTHSCLPLCRFPYYYTFKTIFILCPFLLAPLSRKQHELTPRNP
jgi:hypothetical protein